MALDGDPSRTRRPVTETVGKPRRFARRVAVAFVLTGTIALLRPAPASAHAETVESRPAPGAAVFPAPSTVTVRFTDPLGPDSTIEVVNASFVDVAEGPTRVDAADPRTMTVGLLRDLPIGAYTVAWTAVDATDGHTTSGSFTFRVGDAAPSGRPLGNRGLNLILLAVLTFLVLGAASAVRRRTRGGALAAAIIATALAAGCTPASTNDPTPLPADATPVSAAATADAAPAAGAAPPATDDPNGVPIQISIAASDMAVGEERFAFAILDLNNTLLPDVAAEVTFYRLEGEEAEASGTVPATYYASVLPEAGTYVAMTRFDRAGPWGVAISGTLPDGRAVVPNRVRFEVASRPRSPAVGDMAPPTANRTLATEPDLAALTSDPVPDAALYAMTVDAAVASGKPTVVVFATPGYCQSRICAPVLDDVKAVAGGWRDRVNFIHIEVYKSFSPLVLADEMAAWGLETEPWAFVLTADGHVAARLEGNVTRAELEPLLDRVAGDG